MTHVDSWPSSDANAAGPRPIANVCYLLLDVDHDGVTAEGQRFDVEAKVYRAHARVEDVVIRYPDGRLKLVQRVTPARHAV